MPTKGFDLQIYLPDGDPEGIRLIKKSNWTGIGFLFPKSMISEVAQRGYVDKPGIYILLGDVNEFYPKIYIGEADSVTDRLKQHYGDERKNFWENTLCFNSQDERLNKAHVQYLEARLFELAKTAKRSEMQNANQPRITNLSGAERDYAEVFLEQLLLCCSTLGVRVYEANTIDAVQANETINFDPEFAEFLFTQSVLVENEKIQVKATGVGFKNGNLIVKKDSIGVLADKPYMPGGWKELKEKLLENGVLFKNTDGKTFRFLQDYKFSSTSTAGGIIVGATTNGPQNWKTLRGVPFKEYFLDQNQSGTTNATSRPELQPQL